MIKITFSTQKPTNKEIALVTVIKSKDTEVLLLPSGQKEIRLGLEDPKKMTRRKLVPFLRKVVTLAKSHKFQRIALNFSDFSFSHLEIDDRELAEMMGINFEMVNFAFTKYKTPPKEGWKSVEEIVIVTEVPTSHIKKGFEQGQIIGTEINASRALCNMPGNELYPEEFVKQIIAAARKTSVKAKVLGVKEMQKLGMNGVLAVGRGSVQEPRFLILEYFGGTKKEKPIVLVGKGVTFDSGGLNLKPFDGLMGMHMDMSGGAAVAHTLLAASKIRLKKNVVGLIPLVENMPSGSSYRPGDIIKMMSGKTVEIYNTDAEGRVILADGLTYAERYNPRLVVDVATLTGAAMLMFGNKASALFTPDEKLEKLFRDLGEQSGDYVWPLPLWEEYEEDIKGRFADFMQISLTSRFMGSSVAAAVFLHQFAKKFPWVHLDIAPRMVVAEHDQLSKGSAGAPIRLLMKLLEIY